MAASSSKLTWSAGGSSSSKWVNAVHSTIEPRAWAATLAFIGRMAPASANRVRLRAIRSTNGRRSSSHISSTALDWCIPSSRQRHRPVWARYTSR